MNAVELLKEIRSGGGRLEACGDRLHIDVPAGTLTPELRKRLKQHKSEILRRLDLEAIIRRVEVTTVCIAIWDDGKMRLVQDIEEGPEATEDGRTVYAPADLYYDVQLEPPERRLLYRFKRRFGGTAVWREQ
jgi:TubC N-terminal docking domain